MTKPEINEQYVRGYALKLGVKDLPQESVVTIMDTMKKYGDNRWWESNDPVVLAYHQLHEEIMMIELDKLYEGATKICGRDVYSHDLWMDRKNLMKEVEVGMKRLQNGTCLSEEVQEAAVERSIQRLEQIVKKNGGKVIRINTNSEERDTSGYDGWLNPQ